MHRVLKTYFGDEVMGRRETFGCFLDSNFSVKYCERPGLFDYKGIRGVAEK